MYENSQKFELLTYLKKKTLRAFETETALNF